MKVKTIILKIFWNKYLPADIVAAGLKHKTPPEIKGNAYRRVPPSCWASSR